MNDLKKKNVPAVSAANYDSSMTGVTDEQAFDLIGNAPAKELTALTGNEVFTSEGLNEGDKVVFKFIEMTTWREKDGTTKPAVLLQDKDGKIYITPSAVITNNLQKVTELPCFVRFDYKGKVKSANGTYDNWDIYTFPSQAAKL